MATGYVLTNDKAGNGGYARALERLKEFCALPLVCMNVEKITDYAAFLGGLEQDDLLILAGGDGTLHHFINNTRNIPLPPHVLYYPIGTGNDFARELGKGYGAKPFPIREYLLHLPTVEVNGMTHCFLNGVGFGIDGYCTQEGDRLRRQGKKKVNYTSIAIRGLFGGFQPVNAEITVDGVHYSFRRVLIAPTMLGKCYGGGMYPTPQQDRCREDQTLSVMVFHSVGKWKALMIFPSIFQGKHIRHTEAVTILEGKDIRVEFDRPSPLQIDGETVPQVLTYHARAAEGSRREVLCK